MLRRIALIITVFFLGAYGLFYILNGGLKAAAEPAVNPHGNYDINSQCEKCHSTHSSLGSYLMTSSTQRETCYSCHDGSNSSPNIRGEFGEETIGSSVYSGSGSLHPVPTGTQKCTNCHDPHLANEKSAGGTAGLLAVGEAGYSSGNDVCGACHGSGSSLPGGDMLADFVYTPHDTSMDPPASGTLIKCVRCHQPHGSPYDMLLRNTITGPGGVVYQVNGNNNSVCFGCHTDGMGGYSGSATFNAVFHGSKTTSTVATTTYGDTGYEATLCLNCHEPHGKTGISDYRRDEGNALCAKCHDDSSVVRPDNYSYRGIDTYNNTPHGSLEPIAMPYLYTTGTDGTEIWEASGYIDQQPTPDVPGNPAGAGPKNNISVSDSSFWVTDLAVAQDVYNYQVYKFHVTQDVDNIRQLKGKWVGYGEPTTGHDTSLLIWNKYSLDWEMLDTALLGDPAKPGTLSWSKSTGFEDYLDANNDIYILAQARHDASGPVITGVNAGTISATGAIINWTTGEYATSYVYYGTVANVYPDWVSVDGYALSHSVPITGLTNDVTYHYQVVSVDKLGNESRSADYTFHTSYAPSVPTGLSGPATDPSPNNWVTVNFSWNPSTDLDPTDTVTGYQVEVRVDGNYYTTVSTDTNSCSVYLGYDGPGTVSWQVRAKDNHNTWSAWSAPASFPHTGPAPDTCAKLPDPYPATRVAGHSNYKQDKLGQGRTGIIKTAFLGEPISAASPAGHYSLNTDYVELEVRAVDPTVPNGYCGNCHTPHGKADAYGNPFPKQLQTGLNSTCFGGGLGCHSDPDNSFRGINIYEKFNSGSNPLNRHSVDPAEQQAGGTRLDCVNCHEPHLNTATNRLVDPANRYSLYYLNSNIPEYMGDSGEVYLRVRARHDGQEPAFTTNPYVSYMSDTSANITWGTNEKTSGYVEYGPTTAYGSRVDKNYLATSFTAGLSGLELYTNYHYRVYAVDPSGNYVFSGDQVLDSTPPVITSGPSVVNSTGTECDVTWQTNEKASRWVEYNDTVNYTVYGFTYSEGTNSSPGTSHSVHLSGLVPGTEYIYRVKSQDVRGNTKTSGNFTFKSSNSPGVPTITSVSDSAPGQLNFKLSAVWNTVYDPDPGDTVEYYMELSTNNFASTVANSGWTSSTNWSIDRTCDYDTTTTYYFRVKARDNWGAQSLWSTVKTLTHYGPSSGGSCPILYSWNGKQFEFITDLASSNVGLEIAPGRFSVPIPDLPVIIPWGKLQEKDGLYTIKIKTERDEVDFIDNLVLQAVDHPEGTRLALNDFQREDNPTIIHTYAKDVRPVKKATYVNNPTYNGGQKSKPVDITAEVSKIDNWHASGTLLDDNQFTLDLGDLSGARHIKLVAIGWTEYADETDRARRVENAKKGIKPAPRLIEILQPDGTWKSEKIRHFSGYTKPVVIDLTGKFPEGTTKYVVRLRGMYRPHFDFFGVDTTPDSIAEIVSLQPLTAQLEYRGTAKYTKFPAPYHDYDELTNNTLTHEGRFTRYGDVLPLVEKVDDKLVVMDTGDELTVTFKALPPPGPGMTRTFVLKPWQYYKEYEYAKSHPMPFRDMEMTNWPDSLGEYPRELEEYVKEWNTRIHGDFDESSIDEDKSGIFDRIKGFLSGILDWLQGLWARLFGGPETRTADSVYREIPYQPNDYPEDFQVQPVESHYSLNTDYIELQADKGTAISVYKPDSAGFGMWESSTDPSPSAPGSSALGESSAVLSDNNVYFTTDYYPTPNQDDGKYNYQMFRFAINEDPAKLYSFNIFWKGYGENSDGYNVSLGVWNFVYSRWDDVINQKMGSETAVSVPRRVDMQPYCNKCHSGSVPLGVDLGPITKNIGATYTGDIHGSAGGYQTYVADYGIGRVNGTIKNPYTRGTTTLQCYDCHDLHGSENIYHLKENPNGQTPGKISGTGLANNSEFLAFCQSCHAGTLYNFHQGCLGCHHEDHGDSNPPMADDFGRACASCHYHGAIYPAHSSGCDHCYLGQPVRAF